MIFDRDNIMCSEASAPWGLNQNEAKNRPSGPLLCYLVQSFAPSGLIWATNRIHIMQLWSCWSYGIKRAPLGLKIDDFVCFWHFTHILPYSTMKMTSEKKVVIYFFVPEVPTVILRYCMTSFGEVCILRFHCSTPMTSQWGVKIFFEEIVDPAYKYCNFRFGITLMVFA